VDSSSIPGNLDFFRAVKTTLKWYEIGNVLMKLMYTIAPTREVISFVSRKVRSSSFNFGVWTYIKGPTLMTSSSF